MANYKIQYILRGSILYTAYKFNNYINTSWKVIECNQEMLDASEIADEEFSMLER